MSEQFSADNLKVLGAILEGLALTLLQQAAQTPPPKESYRARKRRELSESGYYDELKRKYGKGRHANEKKESCYF
ncbi:MAG TPA: hypothetical protein VFW58_08580 [Trichococcus sp.]|nr:hypothetical protein [Trichococcus sp.]